MAKLTSQHKRAIIERLACYESPTEVQAAMKSEYAIDVSLPQILYYKPESAGTELGQAWKDLHAQIRKRFLEDTSDIAIAQKSYRLRRLEQMSRAAEGKKNYPLAAQLLEQAAKEVGEAYTNRRHVRVDGQLQSGVLVAPAGADPAEWAAAARAQQEALTQAAAAAVGG